MAATIAAPVLDALLLGPARQRRQLQDFPVLGDVWTSFAARPGDKHDLLIVPTRERPTGEVASLITTGGHCGQEEQGCSVAYLQDLVVASFRLEHLYTVLIPATSWWDAIQDGWAGALPSEDALRRWIKAELSAVLGSNTAAEIGGAIPGAEAETLEQLNNNDRQAAKLGLLLGVFVAAAEHQEPAVLRDLCDAIRALGADRVVAEGARAIGKVVHKHLAFEAGETGGDWKGVIFQVTMNREASPAVTQSVAAIKADAARSLFSVSCRDIGWAVLDSGIDQEHPAFADHKVGATRRHRIKGA